METLTPKLTNAGMRALLNASNTGVEAAVSHIAFGDGNGNGYTPQANQTDLANERARIPVGGGERVGNSEIVVEALFDFGPAFWIREVAFVLSDGTFLAVWSDPEVPLQYKNSDVPLVLAYNLVLEGAPADTVTVNVSGPSINITIAGPFSQLAAELIRLQRRAVETETTRLIPQIQSAWR